MTIDDLVQQIDETERLIVVYRNADEVVVGTQDQIYSRRGLINRTIFTAAEIGDQIVNILERRLATMRAQLEELDGKGLGQGRWSPVPAGWTRSTMRSASIANGREGLIASVANLAESSSNVRGSMNHLPHR